MNTNCNLCHGMGWYWAKMSSGGEFSRPCPNCCPDSYAKWSAAGEQGRQVHKELEKQWEARQKKSAVHNISSELPQMELPERRAYFGMVYNGNKLEAHDVNVIHDLRLTEKERAYLGGALDMAIYHIMELRRAEHSKAKVGGVSEFLAMTTDRTESFIVIEPIEREVEDE